MLRIFSEGFQTIDGMVLAVCIAIYCVLFVLTIDEERDPQNIAFVIFGVYFGGRCLFGVYGDVIMSFLKIAGVVLAVVAAGLVLVKLVIPWLRSR